MTSPDCLACWPIASPEVVGLDPTAVAAFVAEVDAFCPIKGARSLALVKEGRLVWAGDEAGATYNCFSVSKAVTCTVAGVLHRQGKLDLDCPAAEALPFLQDLYPAVTARHLLTMTSGYNAHGGRYGVAIDGLDREPNRPTLAGGGLSDGSMTPLDPVKPLFAPGTHFHYHDDAMRLLGALLAALAGEPIDRLFARIVAEPIGLDGWFWDAYLANGLGPDAASGFFTNALGLAKLGQLWLDGGRGLFASEWHRLATTPQVDHLPQYDGPLFRGLAVGGVFGFCWRSNAGRRTFAHLPGDAFWISGWNHIKLFAAPSIGLVIARLGFDGAVPNDDARWDEAFACLLS